MLLVLSGSVYAQNTGSISGVVRDAETDVPIPGAHVFLANTTIGDITDANGYFSIQDVQAGSYQIIARIIGFQPARKTIRISTDTLKDTPFKLTKQIYEVGAITVTDNRPSKPSRKRRRDLTRFKRMFLGTTPTRQGCEIENPHVIEFTRLSGFFEASSNQPIVITNKYLGYRISYLLDLFSTGQNLFRFKGEPFFVELPPRDDKEAERWKKRRTETYNGSFQHFLRSAAQGTLVKEGFDVYLTDSLYWKRPHKKLIDFFEGIEADVKPADYIKPHTLPHERELYFSGFLHVIYNEETMHRDFYDADLISYSASREPVRAVIRTTDGNAIFNEIGFLNNAFDIARYGYWNWESGICNWLPFNYGLEPAG
ncbi:MAG: carboxypeptidase-like regulatory domain-containing protein [Bacteroidota bacterium]